MTNEHLCQLAKEGDSTAQNTLLETLLPSIRIAAAGMKKNWSGLQIEAEDLIQEALIGALRAIHTFRPEKGVLFQSYASYVAGNAMRDYIRTCRAELPASGPVLSLDATPPGFEATDGTYADILFNTYALSPETICIQKETITEVRNALQMISIRERTYLHFRFGFIDDIEHDRKETAAYFHLSTSRAKSIEKSALRNCRMNLP